ncbi:hypothetical protein ACQ0QQ_01145 [Lysinibacillus sphaericus]
MSIKFYAAGFLACNMFLLTACNGSGEAPEKDGKESITEQTNADDTSEAEERSNEASDEPGESQKKKDTAVEESSEMQSPGGSGVDEKTYSTEEEAAGSLKDYTKIKQTNIDLGHGIKGFQEGAAGHEYLSWNEGRWLIRINYPTDSRYAVDGYDGGSDLAREVVDYLEDHYLPAPNKIGMIEINGFKDHPETVVKWQDGKKIYTITSNNEDPFEALNTAVESNKS